MIAIWAMLFIIHGKEMCQPCSGWGWLASLEVTSLPLLESWVDAAPVLNLRHNCIRAPHAGFAHTLYGSGRRYVARNSSCTKGGAGTRTALFQQLAQPSGETNKPVALTALAGRGGPAHAPVLPSSPRS
jgi:hypothetical protein